MTPEEIAKLIKNADPAIVRDRPVGSRRYNLIVFRNTEQGKQIVETIEYLTRKQAQELKAEYLREDSLRCDIIEDVTTDRNGKEIVFTEKPEPTFVVGVNKYGNPHTPGTATATKLITEKQRRAARSKASFVKKLPKSKVSGKTIRYTNSWTDPKSPLYPMYIDNVKRRGFTVVNKMLHEKFMGMQEEVNEYIRNFLNTGGKMNELDISFNGV